MDHVQRPSRLTHALVLVLAFLVGHLILPRAWSQPPRYAELFQDPPVANGMTQADLPNLGRMVTLEATAMFVNARAELADSPAGFQLIPQIQELERAADSFTASVSFYRFENDRVEAGRLTFPDLDQAFQRIRANLGALPGSAPATAVNFANLSRLVAVIGPLLRQTPAEVESTTPVGDASLIRTQARQLARTIDGLRNGLADSGLASEARQSLDRELERLVRLTDGLARIAVDQASLADVIASFRPIRAIAQSINLGITSGRYFTAAIDDSWRPIQRVINSLSEQFQLPRVIELRGTNKPLSPGDSTLTNQLDQSAREIEALLAGSATSTDSPVNVELFRTDVERLSSRLDLLRQGLLAHEPARSLHRRLLDVETARLRFDLQAQAVRRQAEG